MKAENIIAPVSIQTKAERPYLGIRFNSLFPGMFANVTKELKILRSWVNRHIPNGQGPYFLRYYHCDMKAIMEIEVGFVTAASRAGDGVIQPGVLPAGQYASLAYRGNGLRANQAIMKWAKDNGVQFEAIDPNLAESYACRYEAYLTDYRVESRKLLWDVELSLKIVG